MRKDIRKRLANAISCSSTPYTDCTITERQRLTEQTFCSFTNCNFSSISNTPHTDQHGGALSYDVAHGTLFVSNCDFYDCVVNVKDGGAIDARNADYVTVEQSIFDRCISHTTSTASGGCGINLYNITQHPFVIDCTFISCATDEDGGGMSVSQTAPENTLLCEGCRFINNQAKLPQSNHNWAGGIMIWGNPGALKCSNLLFTNNEATFGGAYGTNYNIDSPDYPLRFCFFHDNSATNGKDVCFYGYKSSYATEYFLHCFSTSEGVRVKNFTSEDNCDWLSMFVSTIVDVHMCYYEQLLFN